MTAKVMELVDGAVPLDRPADFLLDEPLREEALPATVFAADLQILRRHIEEERLLALWEVRGQPCDKRILEICPVLIDCVLLVCDNILHFLAEEDLLCVADLGFEVDRLVSE